MTRQAVGRQEQTTGPGFVRRNGWVLVIAVLLTLIAVVTTMTWMSQSARLDGQQAQIETLQRQLETAELENSQQLEDDLLQSLGISQERIATDTPTIIGLIETAFTWDSGASYAAARAELKARYDLSEDGVFLTDFMPESRYNEDADGKRYYYIDTQGMNSSVSDDPEIEVVKVRADDYTYAVMVDVTVTSDGVEQDGGAGTRASAERRMLLFLTIDTGGEISNLSGVPASGSTRHSG